ncbi:MMPL family transporter [Azospirillum sp.]|uniref:efflux RND transporter permease subunit n=1 Tax=Azospirillum sp. TaxID=34012 RepID=UPI00260C9B48|nr:MMPL family transporter [Azospirillum sp.]
MAVSPTVDPAETPDLAAFDPQSGSRVERVLFNNRLIVVCLCVVMTLILGWQASALRLNASFEKTIPRQHPFIAAYMEHQQDLRGLGNAVRIVVSNGGRSIYEAAYLDTLRQINDAVFLTPGVDRSSMKSLWTPNTRWIGVTEDGMDGGPVIPDGYDGSPVSLGQLRVNVARSGEIGQIVALDGASSALYVPLLSALPDGTPFDYAAFSQKLEEIRQRFERPGLTLHVTGFAKIVGDLIDGLREVLLFLAVAIVITTACVLWFTRCVRSTALVVVSSMTAVVWQLGLLPTLGMALDPYSILVPFLVFAIGMSHGAQKMNGIMQDIGRGAHKYIAARLTFRRLFLAGLTALLADAVGFAVLLVIDIQVIRELAIAASLGVAVLIFTNLILLPILLSYTGVSAAAAARSLKTDNARQTTGVKHPVWAFLDRFTRREGAMAAVLGGVALAAVGLWGAEGLKIGDLDPGAPELRPDSRYNRDVAYINAHYGASSDVFAVMVETKGEGSCAGYEALRRLDALEWELRQLEGVETTNSLAQLNRDVLSGLNEANPKWVELIKNQAMLNFVTAGAPRGLYNEACTLLTLFVYLKDHKADTLDRVVARVERFAADNDTPDIRFRLAAGSAGIEAATNIVVKQAWRQMLYLVYGAVMLLSFITFRSWRAVLVAVLPLMLTSVLAEALMVWLGMGVKVATLPVIALGVGIGVDYALYILSVTLAMMRAGMGLSEAYYRALIFTGKVVILTGVTLAAAVATWAFSDIKFQADMGILLAFMFLWNMVGALVLLPALAYLLLPGGKRVRHAEGHAPSSPPSSPPAASALPTP